MLIPARRLLPSSLGERMQLAFVVRDLQASLRYWTETLNVGPFVVIKNATRDRRFVHRGQPSPVEMDIGFSYFGDVQLEIICQTNAAASPYQEFLASGREGVHHLGFWPDNFDAACRDLEQKGCELVSAVHAPSDSGHVNYYDAPQHLGVMVELAPLTPDRLRYFGGIKALADSWDGSRPIRTFDSRAEYMASPDCKLD